MMTTMMMMMMMMMIIIIIIIIITTTTRGQRRLTKSRIARRVVIEDYKEKLLTVYKWFPRCVGSKSALSHYFGRWLTQQLVLPYNPPFAANTAKETASAFEWAGQPKPYCPLSWRISTPSTIHGSFDLCESDPKRHLDRFSRFYRAHERDQQTD